MNDSENVRGEPEYVTYFRKLKNPEYKTFLEEFLEDPNYRSVTEADADKILSEWRAQEIKYFSQFDLKILDAMGITLNELLDMRLADKLRKAGGGIRKEIVPKQIEVLKSFIESEKRGRVFSETVRSARDSVAGVSEKTMRTWLKTLIEFGACDVPPPRSIGKR